MMSKLKSQSRIDTFDLMRGYFVLIIIIDHLQRWPGIFDWFTGQGRLWVSAAEGFIFISGIMIGLIRGRGNYNLPLWTVTKKLWGRAFTLYIWAILTALLTLSLVGLWPTIFFPFPPGMDSYGNTGLSVLFETLTFKGTFGWSVFLQQYAIYLFIAPAFVYFLRRDQWWLPLGISALVWMYGWGNNQYFLSWQFLFFIGATIGYYYQDIRKRWAMLKHRKLVQNSLLVAGGVTLLASIWTIFAWPIVKQSWSPITYDQMLAFRPHIDPWFIRSELRPVHLVLALLWFVCLYIIFRRFDTFIKRYAGWMLMRFGQNSLFVYIVQGLVVVVVSGLLPWPDEVPILVNALITIGAIMLIWWIAGIKWLYKIIPR